MGVKILLFITMLFCHIVDDFYLQGWLASAKQKTWWKKNAPEPLYKYDYLMALFMHSFSWTFMITLPLTIYAFVVGGRWYISLFIINIITHFITDDIKANKKQINLIQDQLIHVCQIIITWTVWMFDK